MAAFEPLAAELRPDAVVVVGDVNSTVGCALVTAKSAPCWRTWKRDCGAATGTCPRKSTGVVTDRLSDYLFAPSADAVDNLRAEGYRPDQIHLAGNVMVDTLLANLDRALASDVLSRLGSAAAGTPW